MSRAPYCLLVVLFVCASLVLLPYRDPHDRPLEGVARPVGQAPTPTATALPPERPNIVLIVTDDQDVASLRYMPSLQSLLVAQGTSFVNAFVTDPLCCPSRASILRGQYPHNHGVLSNAGPRGGAMRFHQLGHHNSTIATWLQESGYRTALVGKYMNGYPWGLQKGLTYVPPGWSEWYARIPAEDASPHSYYDYRLNANGQLEEYGTAPEDYLTDVLANEAVEFVDRSARSRAPFFLYLAPPAPHDPATPARRHASAAAEARVPRRPSLDEADVSDKPAHVQRQPLLGEAGIEGKDRYYRKRVRSLLAVDDMIWKLVYALETTGELENTFLVFTSDNGFLAGEHRLDGKNLPYEEAMRVPLIVRGPGVPAGQRSSYLVLNNDLAPTFAALAGVAWPDLVDGRSLVPLLDSTPPPPSEWRQAFLVEDEGYGSTLPGYQAVRTATYKYVEYTTGERELYHLVVDPYELQSRHATVGADVLDPLSAYLAELRACAGATCRALEDAGLDIELPAFRVLLPLGRHE